tara:strand:+ start:1109 stop:5188 length:4080 start_codon:yes stop_codon:yes gene_type:complete
MPYSSTVNLSIDNDFPIESSGQYTYKVYYSQRNDSILAGEFDAYNSTVSFDISGIYGEVFIDVFLSSASNTSLVASESMYIDYPLDEITEHYSIESFSLLDSTSDTNQISDGGSIYNPAEFDSPDLRVSWTTNYPKGHIFFGNQMHGDADFFADYGLDGFDVKILDSNGSYISDVDLDDSASLSVDIFRQTTSELISGLVPLSGVNYLYGTQLKLSNLEGVTGYRAGVTGISSLETPLTGYIDELWGVTGQEQEIIPAHTGTVKKYNTITGETISGYSSGDPTYLYGEQLVEVELMLPDPNAVPSGLIEDISGIYVDYKNHTSQSDILQNYSSLINNGQGLGQSLTLDPSKNISKISFYKYSGSNDDSFDISYYLTKGSSVGSSPQSFENIIFSGEQKISIGEGWRSIYIPQIETDFTQEEYAFFIFNESPLELRIAQSTNTYISGEMLQNASVSTVPSPPIIEAFSSISDIAFSLDYGEIPTSTITTSGIEQVIFGYETGLIPLYAINEIRVDVPETGIQETYGIVDYLSGVTGYETRCVETGVIGTGVVDYYISPVTYQIQNITGFLTGCISEESIELSGITGVVSGVVRRDTVITGYQSVLQGYETGAITGYDTGIIRPLYEDSLVTSIIEEDLTEIVTLESIYGYSDDPSAERPLILQSGLEIQEIVTGSIYENSIPIYTTYTERVEDGFETGIVEEVINYIPLYGVTGYTTGVTGTLVTQILETGFIPMIGITGTGLVESQYLTGTSFEVTGYTTGIVGYNKVGPSNSEILSNYKHTHLNISYNSNKEIFGEASRSLAIEVTPILKSGVNVNSEPTSSIFYAENKVPSVVCSVGDSEHNKFKINFEVANGERIKVYTMPEENYMQFADPTEFETGVNSDGLIVENSDNNTIYSPTGEIVDFEINNSPDNPFYPYYNLVFDGVISPAAWDVPYNQLNLIKVVPEDDFGTGVHNGIYFNRYNQTYSTQGTTTGYIYSESLPSGTVGDLVVVNGETGLIPIYAQVPSGYGYASVITGYGPDPSLEYQYRTTGIVNAIESTDILDRSDLAPLKLDATINNVSFEDLNNQKDMQFSWRTTQLDSTNQIENFTGAFPSENHPELNIVRSRHLAGFNYGFWDASKYQLYQDFADASASGEYIQRYDLQGDTSKKALLSYSQNINFFPPYGLRNIGFYVRLMDRFDRIIDQKFSLGYIQPPIISGITIDNSTPRQVTFNYEVVEEIDYGFQAPYGNEISREVDPYFYDSSTAEPEDLVSLSGQVIRDKEDKITNLRKIEVYSGLSPDFDCTQESFATKIDGTASNITVNPYLAPKVRQKDYYYKFLTFDHFGSGFLSEPIKATVIGSRTPTGIKPSNIRIAE